MRPFDRYRGFEHDNGGEDRIFVHGFTTLGRWVYGTCLTTGTKEDERFSICCFTGADRVKSVLPDSIGRCTGLRDCDGNFIFEDDVLASEMNQATFLVEWSDRTLSFLAHQIANDMPLDQKESERPMLCQLYIKEEGYRVCSNRFLFALRTANKWNLSKGWSGWL